MDKRLKAKWVKALRSGKFKQTHEMLERTVDGDNFRSGNCCLGVLCRVGKIKGDPAPASGFVYFEGRGDLLAPPLLKKFGLSDSDQENLWKMNDGDGMPRKTFRGIATWIEKNL